MISTNIINWIRNYTEINKIKSLIIGISGGVDSGVVSTLCAKTGLPTYIVSLPLNQKLDQLDRARNHAKFLTTNYNNVIFIEKDISSLFEKFENIFLDFSNELGFANSKSRLRMVSLYQIASFTNGIVVGTGNKVEDFGVGFYTKYGDGGVDISPIADLTKTQVRSLAKELKLNEEIINAKPTDGLWEDDRCDEDQIGASYEELEWAMEYKETTKLLTERELEILHIYNNFNTKNKHKMIPIPVFIHE